jgi:Formate/nitrite transporter
MADQAPVPQPPIFNLNAYSPAEIKEAIEKSGSRRRTCRFWPPSCWRSWQAIIKRAEADAAVLVCLAVWLAHAGRSVTDKIVALILPISAFIAAGFEHCVALLVRTDNVPANFDASLITIPGIVHNLVPVTLGNIMVLPAWSALFTGPSIGRHLARRI